ncbi:MAG: nitroreductase family protein, partial [Lentisphaeria bacterium]|nr:nitroreductase family protein [Lentisphaeria bacterium]
AGYASQNVYLYAASEGLATVVCAMVDRDTLTKAMNLPAGQQIMYSQPIGYPAR